MVKEIACWIFCIFPVFTLSFLQAQVPTATGGEGLDLDGDGMNDLWEAIYDARRILPSNDQDKDGLSNLAESRAGTDPFDPSDKPDFAIDFATSTGSSISTYFSTVESVGYQIESSVDLSQWTPHSGVIPGMGAMQEETIQLDTNSQTFFRLAPKRIDADKDGLSAFEEGLLGFSDLKKDSQSNALSGDYARAVALLSSPTPFMLGVNRCRESCPLRKKLRVF